MARPQFTLRDLMLEMMWIALSLAGLRAMSIADHSSRHWGATLLWATATAIAAAVGGLFGRTRLLATITASVLAVVMFLWLRDPAPVVVLWMVVWIAWAWRSLPRLIGRKSIDRNSETASAGSSVSRSGGDSSADSDRVDLD